MFRLTKLNFKNAMMTSETLFGLGLELAAALVSGLLIAQKGGTNAFELTETGFLPWIAGVFITFALTLDNDSGTVRNRLIAGFSRAKVLLSQIMTAMLLSLVYLLAALLPYVIFCHSMIVKGRTAGDVFLMLVTAACGYLLTGALAGVLATVIFSRTGAVLGFIAAAIAVTYASVELFENALYPQGSTVVSGSSQQVTGPARAGLKLAVFNSPIVQTLLYDEVKSSSSKLEDYRNRIRTAEMYNAADPDFSADIGYMKARLSQLEEQQRDLGFVPLYTLGGIAVLSAAGLLIFRKRNIV